MIVEARQWGEHPSEILGIPETKSAYCWFVWSQAARAAEYEARKRRQVFDQTTFQVQSEALG